MNASLALALALAAPAADRKPNVMLILADDLGWGDLGCYGGKDIRTPHLDRLAASGVRLTDAYAAACVCTPTRVALLTGRYPQRAGFDWVIRYAEKDRGLPATDAGLARRLKAAGYATGVFGKWHLGYKHEFGPNAHGFDESFGFLGADLDFWSHKTALGEPGLFENGRPVERAGYLTDLVTDAAAKFIDRNAGRPFFLFASYNAPHWPFQRPDRPGDVRTKANYGPETGSRADYAAMVESLDANVGRLLGELARRGLERDTLVLFTSDNGGERFSDNGPFFHGKYTLWEGGLRVPLLARWPGVLTAGAVSAQPVVTMDLAATVLTAAGAGGGPPLDGEDVLPVLAGRRPLFERTFYWRLPRPDEEFGMKAARRGHWKYVADRESELLFDLAADPGERRNLAYRHPDRLAELRKAVADWEAGLAR